MDFSWTEEENIWRNTVREFADKNIKPVIRDIDTNKKIPLDIIKKMGKLGLLAPTVSEKYGGANLNWTMSCIAAEELGRADISLAIPVLYLVEAAWGFIFDKYANSDLKKKYLPEITSGNAFIGIAVTEPEGGSDIVGSIKTNAKKNENRWILNGEKIFISGISESKEMGGIHLTLVRTNKSLNHKGFTFFAVPLKNNKNINTSLFEDMGRMGISTGGFLMNNVNLSNKNVIGEKNKGFYYAMEGFSAARVLIGATCVGSAEAALEMGINHIKNRKSFGKYLGSYEGIQFPLAEHYANLKGTKLLTYNAAWIMDKMYNNQIFNHNDVALAAAITKLKAPVNSFEIMNEVADWLGALGYTKEYPIEMGIRGVRSYSIGAEGTMNIMKIIIARELLGNNYLPYK
jgi:acyl-CoA dehydrogenase